MTEYLIYNKKGKELVLLDLKSIINGLYLLDLSIPESKQLKDYKGNNERIKQLITDPTIIQKTKDSISKYDEQIPLYDEYSKNLFLINRNNLYDRVIYQHYRFPDVDLFNNFVKKRDELKLKYEKLIKHGDINVRLSDFETNFKVHYKLENISHTLGLREYRKLNLMISFLSSFNLDILSETYIHAFYKYSVQVGKDITICERPSFLPHFRHISPYYKRSELIALGLNMCIIKEGEKIELNALCHKIVQNDVDATIILKHQNYMLSSGSVGMVQHYSLQGSFFMNKYMRQLVNYPYRNHVLEDSIKSMWELINNAPEFDKGYTLYRFIKNDDHLKHLKIGDIFLDSSFISTTRDPFYRSDIYKFGFILIKINIPSNIKGVALCVETVSYFPEEQEILLSPLTKFRLDTKDEDTIYYHTDRSYVRKIKTRYEFTFVGKEPIKFVNRPIYTKTNFIDFMKINKKDSETIGERIAYFVKNYVNPLYQFSYKMKGLDLVILVEWYNSLDVYKRFYASETNNGFSMYSIVDNHVAFMIEIGNNGDESYMYVNYYFRYSYNIQSIDSEELLDMLCKIAYYFEIPRIVLYGDYISCDLGYNIGSKVYYGGNYCIDFYKYLKYNEKKYDTLDRMTIRPAFSYHQLNRLNKTDPTNILSKNDRDEIYQIYMKVYQGVAKLTDFYIWMVENYCILIEVLITKMDRLFKKSNPFELDYYIIDPVAYLYNKNIISSYPVFAKENKNIFDMEKIDPNLPKNRYRTTTRQR